MAIKLSDTQTTILQAAMNRPTQDIAIDSNVRPQSFAAGVLGLVSKGLVNRVAAKTDIDGSYIQKTDTGKYSFVLNTNAYEAMGAEPDETVTVPKPGKGVAKIAAQAEPEDEETDDETGVGKSGVMTLTYHERYMAQGGGSMDDVDQSMRDAFVTEVTEKYTTKKGEERERKVNRVDLVALREWGEEIELWNEAWENLNPGMQRMNLANRVRGAIRNGGHIKLGRHVLQTAMPEPKEKKARKAKKEK